MLRAAQAVCVGHLGENVEMSFLRTLTLTTAAWAALMLLPAGTSPWNDPVGVAAARGDDQTTDPATSPAAQPRKKIDDSPGELFPGVKGISGAELARRIAESEKRKNTPKPSAPAAPTAPAPTPPATSVPPTPDTPTPSPAPAEPASAPTPATAAAPTAPEATNPTPAPPAQQPPELSYAARTFLKQSQERTDRIDALMQKARNYRSQAEAAAAAVGNETKIQYYLRNKPDTALTEVRDYASTLMAAVSVYRSLYEMTRDALTFAVDKRPADDLGRDGSAATDANVARLQNNRRECLVASAELFTRLRRFDAAEKIYAVLLDSYPNHADVRLSYDAMCRTRDMPEMWGPFWENGPGGGRGGRGGGH